MVPGFTAAELQTLRVLAELVRGGIRAGVGVVDRFGATQRLGHGGHDLRGHARLRALSVRLLPRSRARLRSAREVPGSHQPMLDGHGARHTSQSWTGSHEGAVKPGAFHLDVEAFEAWLHNQLRPFANNVRRAAEFSVRLTAIRLGLLDGPHEPSIEEILDAALWKRKEPEAKD